MNRRDYQADNQERFKRMCRTFAAHKLREREIQREARAGGV